LGTLRRVSRPLVWPLLLWPPKARPTSSQMTWNEPLIKCQNRDGSWPSFVGDREGPGRQLLVLWPSAFPAAPGVRRSVPLAGSLQSEAMRHTGCGVGNSSLQTNKPASIRTSLAGPGFPAPTVGHPYGVRHRRPQAVHGVQPIERRELENQNWCRYAVRSGLCRRRPEMPGTGWSTGSRSHRTSRQPRSH
jgi:hypothetical protein